MFDRNLDPALFFWLKGHRRFAGSAVFCRDKDRCLSAGEKAGQNLLPGFGTLGPKIGVASHLPQTTVPQLEFDLSILGQGGGFARVFCHQLVLLRQRESKSNESLFDDGAKFQRTEASGGPHFPT